MGLQANSINLDALGFDSFDDVLSSCSFGPWVLDVVIIIIKFGVGICCSRGSKGDGDVLRANDVVENVRTIGSIIVES